MEEACRRDLLGNRYTEEYKKFNSIDGIGEKTANTILDYFEDERNIKIIRDLQNILTIEDYKNNTKNGILEGKTILFTGSLQNMTRAEAKAKAESMGAKVLSGISSKLDILVVGEEAGSKLTKAQELGIKTINEYEWYDLVSRETKK